MDSADARATGAVDAGRLTEDRDLKWRFLELAARLLLQYNANAGLICERIEHAARHLDLGLVVVVDYLKVTLVAPDGRDRNVQVKALHLNAAVVVNVLHVLDDLTANRAGLAEATERLEQVELRVPRYGRSTTIVMFGLAASALARLLDADTGAIGVVGASTAAGVIARQMLVGRHVTLFAQPFIAGLIGALFGGVAIHLGWTTTPALCLVVPALMLVPGPHLIIGIEDLLDNHVPSAIGRLSLALGILLTAAFGVLIGVWLTLGLPTAETSSPPARLTLGLDVVLAGIAAGGFGIYYNTPRRVLWVSIACGMVGHGLRYIGLQSGLSLEVSTFFGCGAIGVMSTAAMLRWQLPFSAVAFAGAVTMMPGLFIYESIGNAVRLSSTAAAPDPAVAAMAVALGLKALYGVNAIVLGLLVGAGAMRLASSRLSR
jgi:uncharacterized membrane protein YjjP (DUF1212 family)